MDGEESLKKGKCGCVAALHELDGSEQKEGVSRLRGHLGNRICTSPRQGPRLCMQFGNKKKREGANTALKGEEKEWSGAGVPVQRRQTRTKENRVGLDWIGTERNERKR
jgi:hypothetical protein